MEREFKMRAECSIDLGRFLSLEGINILDLSSRTLGRDFPDREVTFTSTLTWAQLCRKIATIEDGHVMLESLNLADHYTGERSREHLQDY